MQVRVPILTSGLDSIIGNLLSLRTLTVAFLS
jgi:hypothetical protein